jgi:hypothetical protein
MSIERIFRCDWRECEGHIRTAMARPANGFITVTEQWPGRRATHHFCTWDCLLKFSAEKPPTEVVPWAGEAI